MNEYRITFYDHDGVQIAGKITLADEFVTLYESECGFDVHLDPVVQTAGGEWNADGQQTQENVRLLGFTLRIRPENTQKLT